MSPILAFEQHLLTFFLGMANCWEMMMQVKIALPEDGVVVAVA